MAVDDQVLLTVSEYASKVEMASLRQFDDSKNDARWYTTLVLAEIAGLASYVELRGDEGLGVIAIVVFILAAVLLSFIISSILIQAEKRA